MSTVLTVNGVNAPGEKAKWVSFLPGQGIPAEILAEHPTAAAGAWVPKDLVVRPGCTMVVPVVQVGKVATHRSDNPDVLRQRPQVTLWLHRTPEAPIKVLPPEGGSPLTMADFEVADEVHTYAERYDAKAVEKAVDGSEPF